MKIVLEGELEKMSSRVDGTIVLQISTQEIDPSKAGELFSLRGKFIKTLISDTNITSLEEELVDSHEVVGVKKNKTPSQRLRSVIYLVGRQNSVADDDEFYRLELEKIITHYKGKLT